MLTYRSKKINNLLKSIDSGLHNMYNKTKIAQGYLSTILFLRYMCTNNRLHKRYTCLCVDGANTDSFSSFGRIADFSGG